MTASWSSRTRKDKEALAQQQPNTLGGIEFGAVVRQQREADVVRDGELLGAGPVGLIEGHDGMDVRGQGAGEAFEEDATVETSGRTSAKSSPVAGRTAAKITSTAWLERSVCGREGRLGVI